MLKPDSDPQMTQPDAVTFALGHIRASTGHAPDRAGFLAALASGTATAAARSALESHLWEAGPAELAGLVAGGFTSFPMLAALAKELLPPAHPNRQWLAECLPV